MTSASSATADGSIDWDKGDPPRASLARRRVHRLAGLRTGERWGTLGLHMVEIAAGVDTHPLGLGATAALARLVVEGEPSRLPPEVLHQARRCLVDYLGVTLAGQREESADVVLRYVSVVGGTPTRR